jgi:hypothetical protein
MIQMTIGEPQCAAGGGGGRGDQRKNRKTENETRQIF